MAWRATVTDPAMAASCGVDIVRVRYTNFFVGSALAGWDGRRGWLYHVAVHRDERRRGIGRTLVVEVELRLRELGCPKLNLIVWDGEEDAMTFWTAIGYRRERTVEFAKPLADE